MVVVVESVSRCCSTVEINLGFLPSVLISLPPVNSPLPSFYLPLPSFSFIRLIFKLTFKKESTLTRECVYLSVVGHRDRDNTTQHKRESPPLSPSPLWSLPAHPVAFYNRRAIGKRRLLGGGCWCCCLAAFPVCPAGLSLSHTQNTPERDR